MKPIYLPVDLKNEDFQFIHLDVLTGFGVACRFKKKSDSIFDIVDMKVIISSIFGPKEYEIKAGKASTKTNNNDYGYHLSLKITGDERNNSNTPSIMNNNIYECATYENGNLKKSCLIDLHLNINKSSFSDFKGNQLFNNKGIKVDFGTEFCRFYII